MVYIDSCMVDVKTPCKVIKLMDKWINVAILKKKNRNNKCIVDLVHRSNDYFGKHLQYEHFITVWGQSGSWRWWTFWILSNMTSCFLRAGNTSRAPLLSISRGTCMHRSYINCSSKWIKSMTLWIKKIYINNLLNARNKRLAHRL